MCVKSGARRMAHPSLFSFKNSGGMPSGPGALAFFSWPISYQISPGVTEGHLEMLSRIVGEEG